MYLSSISLPVNVIFLVFSGGGGGGGGVKERLIFLIVLAVKLLTGFEALVHPLKKITLGASFVILDGASVVQMLKGIGVNTVQ